MNAVGIIAEYNPFHNGHAHHMQAARALSGADHVIIAMSGNYVQRGEPAIVDKWTRARMALSAGADLVLEIPTAGSVSSSEFYAECGVRLLSHTGLVSGLSFGLEPVLAPVELRETLWAVARAELSDPRYPERLNVYLSDGVGFAFARASALSELTGVSSDLLRKPNLILAVDYCKALIRASSSMEIYPVERSGDYHLSQDPVSPSASILRERLRQGEDITEWLPHDAARFLIETPLAAPLNSWSDLLYDRILHRDAKDLQQILDVSEGLEQRILRVLDHPMPVEEAVEAICTKRYPKARIRRILLRLLLELDREDPDVLKNPPYIRVLGFRKGSEELLSELTRMADVPVITNPSRQIDSLSASSQRLLRQEMLLTDLYFAHVPGSGKRRGAELTEPIIVI